MRYYKSKSFTPGTSLGYLIRRAFQMSQSVLEDVHSGEGLSGTQWSTLVLLMAGRCSTCAELARDLSYDKGAMTRLVDQLEAAGYVDRVRDGGDRRVVQLLLTNQGRAVAERLRVQVFEKWNEWLADWPRKDADTLVALLQRLDATLEKADAK